MTSTLYADEIASINDSKIINLNGVNIVADDVQTGYTLRAISATQANWLSSTGTAAPANAEYITLTPNATLTNERTFLAGTGITTTDNGAGNTFDIDTTGATTKTGRFYNPTLEVDASGRVVDINQGRSMVLPVDLATTETGNLATSFANGQPLDGATLITGNRILIKDQLNQVENGIYIVNASGAPTRDRDFENLFGVSSDIQGFIISVRSGTINAGSSFICNNTSVVDIGLNSIIFRNLAGPTNRLKALSSRDIERLPENVISNRSSIGAHFDIQAPITNNASPFSIPALTGVSIDGKMSSITFISNADVWTITGNTKLVLKNLSIRKLGTGVILNLVNCDDVLIQGCYFLTQDTAINLDGCSRVIIKDCVFEGNVLNGASMTTFANSTSRVIITNCQYKNIVLSNNSTQACIDTTNASNAVITNNSFFNTGRIISLGVGVSIATYNTMGSPSANPSGSATLSLGAGIEFGYINIETSSGVVNNNNLDFNTGTASSGNFLGIVARNGLNNSCINGNVFLPFKGIYSTFAFIGIESVSQRNVVMDNEGAIIDVDTNTAGSGPSFIIVGDNCVSGYIGYNISTFYLSGTPSTAIRGNFYNISSTGNDLFKVIRGNVNLVTPNISIAPNSVLHSIDYWEFNSNSVGTSLPSLPATLPIGSATQRLIVRKNNALAGAGGQIDLTIIAFTGPTGIRFPNASTSFAVLQWTGTQWDAIALGGGAVVF